MSRRQDIPSPLTVRRWTAEDVLRGLQQNGLGDVVQSFRKRNIDGNAFLRLTEIQLTTTWNHEVTMTNIRKITKLIDDIKAHPEKRPPQPLNRPLKTFELRSPNKTDKPQNLRRKPIPPPAFLKNHVKNTDVGQVPVFPASLSKGDPTPAPSASRNWREQIPLLPTTQDNRRQLVPLPSTIGNKCDPSPALLPPAIGNKPIPIPIPPGSGNRRDPSPISIPNVFGNKHATKPDAASFPAGFALGPRVQPPATQDTTEQSPPPIPPSKPQTHQPPCSKKVVSLPCPDKSETREEPGVLLKELSDAFRKMAENSTRQKNGLPTAKPVEHVDRPTPPKPPIALRPPTLKLVPHLPPEPPSVVTAKEEEHVKENVSSTQIPSVAPKSNKRTEGNEEMYENSLAVDYEIYEEPDMAAWEAAQAAEADRSQSGCGDEDSGDGWNSDIYEYIDEDRNNSGEYYIQPNVTTTASSDQSEFESTHVQVEELPVAPSVPARPPPQGLQSSFMSNLKSQLFRIPESKSSETQSSRESNLLTKTDILEEDPKKYFSRSTSPSKEKLTVSSELRKSPTSSTTSLISPNKVNAGQASSLPDQRLPPNLRPLPPTPGTSSFRSGPPNNTLTISRKISSSKTSISQQPWYHNVDRRRGEEIVCNREDGTFLIRPSTQNQNPYTLTIWFGNRVYNIAIRFRPDQKFALGSEKPNEQSFWSLEDMVAYYQTEQLVLYSGGERTGQTSLKSSP